MKVLILGATGMLGSDITQIFSKKYLTIASSRKDYDLTKLQNFDEYLDEISPDVIINCAAMTDVDRCEREVQQAVILNADLPKQLAIWCHKYHKKLVHFSTDYVFDGLSKNPYLEENIPNPMNQYGKTKLAGEKYILQIMSQKGQFQIIRTSWLFGHGGKNFISTILKVAKDKPSLDVVNDQWGNPTFTYDLAIATFDLLLQSFNGIIHICNSGITNWYELACYVFQKMNIATIVCPIDSSRNLRLAMRPKMSGLDLSLLNQVLDRPMPTWQSAVDRYLML